MTAEHKRKWRKLASIIHPVKPSQAELDRLWRDWKAGTYDPTTGAYVPQD